MFFLKYIYNQQVKAGRIANDLAKRSDVLTAVELHSATYPQRINALKNIVKEILTFHETAKVVRHLQDNLDDDQWRYVMKERAGYSKRKHYFDPESHFTALMLDLAEQGRDWEQMTNRDQFIEVCASTLAWLSYDRASGGVETKYCQRCVASITPYIFDQIDWELD